MKERESNLWRGPWLTVKEIFERPGGVVAPSLIINCLNFGVWLWIWIHYWLSLSSSTHFCQSITKILVRDKAILPSNNEKTKTISTIPKPLNNCINKLEFESNIKSKSNCKTKTWRTKSHCQSITDTSTEASKFCQYLYTTWKRRQEGRKSNRQP